MTAHFIMFGVDCNSLGYWTEMMTDDTDDNTSSIYLIDGCQYKTLKTEGKIITNSL